MFYHEKYMQVALEEAQLAFDNNDFPVGCVLVDESGVIATGHRNHSRDKTNEIDHAEIVALRNLLAGGYDTGKNEVVVYSTMEPCLMCFATLILNNIRTIVYGYEDVMGGATTLDLKRLSPLYATMEITVIHRVLRSQCLTLFKQFFQQEDTLYWKDSLLCQYTLDQDIL